MAAGTKYLSHAQRVCRLYKESMRHLQSHFHFRHLIRYECVLLRARFDEHKDEIDMRVAQKLVENGEQEFFEKQHPQPFKFANSPGGGAYGREPKLPDWMLDVWHPLERAQYPEYFALRDKRKQEYIDRWNQKHGKNQPELH